MKKFESIPFQTDDGEEVEFCVLEQTMINGSNYLLVSDEAEILEEDDEEAVVYIMKQSAGEEDGIAAFEFVEDDDELMAVSKVFEQLMEDLDIKVE